MVMKRSLNLYHGTSSLTSEMGIQFLDKHLIDQQAYTFAVMITHYHGQWVMVRHRDRSSWELPAGHVEAGETVMETAHRELFEETGALEYNLRPLVSYSGNYMNKKIFGMVFTAEVFSFGPLPDTEIAEKQFFSAIPEALTYPAIQPKFIEYYLNT